MYIHTWQKVWNNWFFEYFRAGRRSCPKLLRVYLSLVIPYTMMYDMTPICPTFHVPTGELLSLKNKFKYMIFFCQKYVFELFPTLVDMPVR